MAKLTGQFTTPSFDVNNNKTHEAFLHAVVFVFTSDKTKVTRETDAKGKYSFDLANGEYEVSVYLKGNTEKDRFDMRAGEKFTVTATTQADALEKWLQVIGTGGKDELATYYENLLAQMQNVFDDFKREVEFVGTGKIIKEEAVKQASLKNKGVYIANSPNFQISGMLPGDFGLIRNNGASDYPDISDPYIFVTTQLQYGETATLQTFTPYGGRYSYGMRSKVGGGVYSDILWMYHTKNTTIDSNGNIKAASPIIKLFNDHIESNDSFKEKPNFEKLGTGAYKISNTLGLAKEGWYIETPKDKNGLPYFMVDWEQDEESQDVIIRVFKKKLDLETLDFVNGDPVDIGQDQRWIDLRFHEEPQQETELLAEMEVEYK